MRHFLSHTHSWDYYCKYKTAGGHLAPMKLGVGLDPRPSRGFVEEVTRKGSGCIQEIGK